MKKGKKILLTVCGAVIVVPALAAGVFYLHMRAEHKRYQLERARREEVAQGEAVKWVQDKYGFVPEVTDVNLKMNGSLFSADYTGTAEVWMSYENNLFRVFVGPDDTHRGDDYERDAVAAALNDEIDKILPGAALVRFQFVNKGNDSSIIRERFTGDNLDSILSDMMQMTLQIGYVNTDLTDVPDFPILREHEIFTELLSFDSEHHRAQAADTLGWFDSRDGAPMLTGGCLIRTDGNEPFSYDVIDCGDFKIMYRYNQEGGLPRITPEDGDAVISRFRQKYPGTDLPAGTVHGWKIVTDGQAFYLYYPVNGPLSGMRCIDAVDEAELSDETLNSRHSNMYAHGDYYVLECSNNPIHRIAVIENN